MRKVWGVLAVVMMVGCGDPHKQALPADIKAAADDPGFKAKVEKLPQEERELLAGYMMRQGLAQAFSGGTASAGSAKTIGDAINEQRKFLTERKAKEDAEKALAEKVAAERAAAVKAMDEVLTVALTDKTFERSDFHVRRYSDTVTVVVAFQNKSAKDLAAVKGRLTFSDVFDDKIKSSELKMEDPIAAGQTHVWTGTMELNQFNAADKKLAATPKDKLKAVWEPSTYLFKDGTTLKAPDAK